MKAVPVSSPKKTLDKRFSLAVSERCFKRACEQIVLLNGRLSDLRLRFTKACLENRRTYQTSLKLKMAVTQGLLLSYYDYAHSKAETVADLRRELFGVEVRIIGSDDNSEYEDTDDSQDTSDSESDEDDY